MTQGFSERDLADLRLLVQQTGRPVAAYDVTVDQKRVGSAGIYYGGVLLADGIGAATAAIYDGHDATGKLIDFLDTDAASNHDSSWKDRGIRVLYGVYVDLGVNVQNCTVFANPPIPERQ